MKNTMRILVFILPFILCTLPHAMAQQTEADLMNNIMVYSKAKTPEKAKPLLTERSHSLYDRMYKHNLLHLLPTALDAGKKQNKNGFEYVQFYDHKKSQNSYVIMAFKDESNKTKLDLPETFRIGFGENWPQKLDMIEQTYLLTRQYYGERKSVQILENVLTAK